MRVIKVRNVNESWRVGLTTLFTAGQEEDSRNGPVLVYPEPLTTVYRYPQQRVLFCPVRKANPFFHLFESVWMLAGRRDGAYLDQFVHDFSARFAEPSGNIHGAYGARWHADGQLGVLIDLLRREPTTRQAVLSMWDPALDLDVPVRDKPCNTQVYFRVSGPELHMTVCNRSNDAVWGCWGANAVHFSMLQEFVAAAIGKQVGMYWQVSNNLHIYKSMLDRLDVPAIQNGAFDYYAMGKVEACQLFPIGQTSMHLTELFMEWTMSPDRDLAIPDQYVALFEDLLDPMLRVWRRLKDRRPQTALQDCDKIGPSDWRRAAQQWCERAIARADSPAMEAAE